MADSTRLAGFRNLIKRPLPSALLGRIHRRHPQPGRLTTLSLTSHPEEQPIPRPSMRTTRSAPTVRSSTSDSEGTRTSSLEP